MLGGRRLISLLRSSPPAQRQPLAGHRLNIEIESVVSDGLVLVEGEAQIGEGFVVEGAAEKLAIRGAPRRVVRAEGEVERMRRHQRIRLSEGVGAVVKRGSGRMALTQAVCLFCLYGMAPFSRIGGKKLLPEDVREIGLDRRSVAPGKAWKRGKYADMK
jgi:hypothetical protein